MTAEENDPGREIRIKPKPLSLGSTINRNLLVKLLLHHHARCEKYVILIVPMLEGLLLCSLRSTN